MTGGYARREKPSRYAFSTREITFDDRQGHLFVPDRPETPPVVVLAPGAGLRWRAALEPTAERLAARGYAVFAFDHRGFGGSEEPRSSSNRANPGEVDEERLLSPARQRADLDAAIEAMQDDPAVDGDRLALWGMDLSAGTALAAAADSFRVDAVVARFPVLAGKTLLPGWVRPRLRGLVRGVADYPISALGRLRGVEASERGHHVPLFGEPGETAAIVAPGAERSVRTALGRDPGTTPARSFVTLQRHDCRDVLADLSCPALFVAGAHDEVAPAERVAAASEEAPDASLVRVPADHYSALDGEGLERTLNHELAFLDAELRRDASTKHL
ncbi:alpha/beta hydrolase [Halolamina salifodinae]|uniref:Dienelactone hydrolase n=1 Tax=Halolamina salifodinae TaxID=1202767 RepID=A0A8T4GWY9_9EURY|nr:alpha/beta fold hydrolase [Halolamina salifodinae]MBP1987517.1 dienelactone hydrolase [Halolamina salifodinae]